MYSASNNTVYYNTNLVKHKDLKEIKEFVDWALTKFFKPHKKAKIYIEMEFHRDLQTAKGMFGSCIWEDTYYRPNEFKIEIHAKQEFKNLLNTIAHELAHVKQWSLGQFYEVVQERKKNKKIYKFVGKRVDTSRVGYLDQPWEIEAIGLSVALVVQWCNATGRNVEDYVHGN
jgi:hypothetical protein